MKTIALVSGGKDSCFNMMLCQQYGHEVVALANLLPEDAAVDEMDSYMFQTVGHQLVAAYAACTGLPLFRRRIRGASKHQGLAYEATEGDEVEDLFQLLAFARTQIPDLEAVSSGAIASDYQRLRVEQVCGRLGLVSLAYLWHQPQGPLLSRMIASGLVAVLVKSAAMGLNPRLHLGRSLSAMHSTLLCLHRLYGCNVCGEGGEYETLTLDCPIFRRGSIALDAWEMKLHSPDSMAPVGILHPLAFHVVPKSNSAPPAPPRSAFLCQSPSNPGSTGGPSSHDAAGSGPLPAPPGIGSPDAAGGLAGSPELGLGSAMTQTAGGSEGGASLGSGSGASKDGKSPGNVARWLEGPLGTSESGFRVSQASSLRELPSLAQACSLPGSLEAGAKSGDGEGVSWASPRGPFSGSSGTSILTESTEDYARMLDGLPGSLEEAAGRLPGWQTALESVAEDGLPQGLTAWLVEVPDDFCGAGPLGDPPEVLPEGAVAGRGLRRSSGACQAWCAAVGRGESGGERIASALRCALSCLARELREEGLSLGAALMVHLYLADMAYFGAANAEYCRHVPVSSPPARACLQAPLPPHLHVLVELLLPSADQRGTGERQRKVLHVQSWSEWAPSCIGPYSQGVAWGPLLRLAGQIGLHPPTMSLVSGGPLPQAEACVRNCAAVAIAMGSDLRQGMLACNLYSAQEGAAQNLAALAEAVSGYLEGRAEAPLEEAGHSRLEVLSEEEEEEYVEAYLRPPPFPKRSWRPLLCYMVMGGLPRGAAVELEPLAFSLQQPLIRDRVSWGLAGKEHGAEHEPHDSDDDMAAGRQWGTAIEHGTREWGYESSSGRVECSAEFLFSPSYFLRVHVSVTPPASASASDPGPGGTVQHVGVSSGSPWIEGAAQTMWQHVASLLEQAKLSVEWVVEATAYYNVNVLSSEEVGVALTAGAPVGLGSSIPCVPTLGIGPDPSVNAAYQLQLTASAL